MKVILAIAMLCVVVVAPGYAKAATDSFPPQDSGAGNLAANTHISAHLPPAQETLEETLDHFQCYITTGRPVNETVHLRDQFGETDARVLAATRFCNPVQKTYEGRATEIQNPDHHLKLYRIEAADRPPPQRVIVTNQFATDQQLTVFEPLLLAVPTHKLLPGGQGPPRGLNHFKCYRVEGEPVSAIVSLRDQFHREPQVSIQNPSLLCNPVEKTRGTAVTEVLNPAEHLLCYQMRGTPFRRLLFTRNQFDFEFLAVGRADLLCVPTKKTPISPQPVPGELTDGPVRAAAPQAAPPIFQGCVSPTPDFVVTGSETTVSGDEHCFPSNGAGMFGPRSDIPRLTRVDGMDVADMDGDGNNDFLACDGNTGEVYLYIQGAAGVFSPSVVATGITSGVGGSVFCTYLREGDFNADGLKDFVVGDNRVTQGMFVYLQGPVGTFTPVAPGLDVTWASPNNVPCNCLFGVAVGDVDGDGHQDVLVLGYRGAGAGQLHFYQGDGTGGMGAPVLLFNVSTAFPVASTPTGLALFDLEGDGDLDIIAGGSADGTHYIYTNDGVGNFTTPAVSVFDVDNYTGIDAYDFDGNGDDDLVLVDWSTRQLLYVANTGGILAAPSPEGVVDGNSIGIGAPQLLPPTPVGLDHFKCYIVQTDDVVEASAVLRDQFGEADARVLAAVHFCNPVQKTRLDPTGNEEVTPIQNWDHHLKFYQIESAGPTTEQQVVVSNQFGENQPVTVFDPTFLAVPTQKVEPEFHEPPKGLDHFKCYKVEGEPVDAVVDLQDQFHEEGQVQVQDPLFLCNPAAKQHEDTETQIQNPDAHLMCYQIEGQPFDAVVQTANQFGEEVFNVERADLLCVPSRKLHEPPPLDHFKCYVAAGTEPVDVTVGLRDQFGNSQARVAEATRFCNPVAKTHTDTAGNQMVTPIQNPDHHLKLYRIESTPPDPTHVVSVTNQFGANQQLTVSRARFLAVPTQKQFPGEHPPPAGLDHFKCYQAEGEPVDALVALTDQFHEEPEVRVREPFLLCNPVTKHHAGAVVEAQNPDAHLTCYQIQGTPFALDVRTNNQFGQEGFNVRDADLLCVPSSKQEITFDPHITHLCGDLYPVSQFDGGMVLPGDPGTGLYRENPDATWPAGRPHRPCGRWVAVHGFLPNTGITHFRVAYRQAGAPLPPMPGDAGTQAIQTEWHLNHITTGCTPDPLTVLSTQILAGHGDGWMDYASYEDARTGVSTGGCPNPGLRLAVWQTHTLGDPDKDDHYVLWLEWRDGGGVFHREPFEHHLQLDNTLPVINDLLVTLPDGTTPVPACGETSGEHLFKVFADFEDDPTVVGNGYYWSYQLRVRGGNPPTTVSYPLAAVVEDPDGNSWHDYYEGTPFVANTDTTGTTPDSTTVFLRDIDMNDFGDAFTDCCYLLELFVRDAAIRHSFPQNNVVYENTGAFWDDVSQFITFSAAP